ncbi:iron-siderophore ABC transporter substrate-binding protein [Halobacillus sp. A1]|uniref:ABC transporter substrate-binding protein n=1 Tax=Halobacillus sp. A1 TaxID=2880262 RepID=UPI0020A6C614|nr:iron-siderophore ABC transporter substrate-binding protein [Halobacillus sp. A1]MCP3032720.1 iron-siderophore ABC transporter substrate-binding protein [Halobacillus sp. A1]
MLTYKKSISIIVGCFVLIFLAACSSDEGDQAEENSEPEESEKVETFEHTAGETEIEGVPEDVVVLAEPLLDHTLALGVTPVGSAAQEEGFVPYLEDEAENVTVIGGTNDPNLESIVELSPDLILGFGGQHDEVYDQLEAIAPTVLVDPNQTAQENLKYISSILDKEEEADEFLAEYDEKAEQVQASLEESVGDETVAFIRIREKEVRVYGGTRNAGSILYDDLGLTPSDIVPLDKWAEAVSIEALPEDDPDHIFLLVDENAEDKYEEIQQYSIFEELEAVQKDQVYSVGFSPWVSGYAPLGNMEAINIVDEHLNEGAGN